jgi:DNA-directed RNA polymerase subunit M/transcription elongation factor TFIIS
MIVNENASNIMQYAGSIGECVLIRVLDTDYVMAKQALSKLEAETSKVTCSNCGSANVEYGTGAKNAMMRVMLLFSFLFASPGRIRLGYRCSDCGNEFRKSNL